MNAMLDLKTIWNKCLGCTFILVLVLNRKTLVFCAFHAITKSSLCFVYGAVKRHVPKTGFAGGERALSVMSLTDPILILMSNIHSIQILQ